MKFGPTTSNSCPARILFLRTPDITAFAAGPSNVDKTLQAPVTAIIAYDLKFYQQLPKLFPRNLAARGWFADSRPWLRPRRFATVRYREAT